MANISAVQNSTESFMKHILPLVNCYKNTISFKGLSVWVQSRLDSCPKDTYIRTYIHTISLSQPTFLSLTFRSLSPSETFIRRSSMIILLTVLATIVMRRGKKSCNSLVTNSMLSCSESIMYFLGVSRSRGG